LGAHISERDVIKTRTKKEEREKESNRAELVVPGVRNPYNNFPAKKEG